MTDLPPPAARERLLDATEQLIYRGGIHATGVDAIIRRSGTARKSFYTHFASKDDLVAAALRRRDERWMAWFESATLRSASTPAGRLLGMFDVLHGWFSGGDFHGCAFLNAAGEIQRADHAIFAVARQHKERLLGFVETCCVACAPRGAAALARQWLILIDGAIGVALVSGEAAAARDARDLAERLLASLKIA
jgi:AcrR family transcriptional regulator